jgi:hypothetical protein
MIGSVESPSLVESLIRLPGALLRLPASTVAALDAINDLADRLDRLMTLLERVEGGVSKAGNGMDLAALGIARAFSGLGHAVGNLDTSFPSPPSDPAAALRTLAEGLSNVAFQLGTELPKATKSLQDASPELSGVVGSLDERFAHLDEVVTELVSFMEATIGTIPGMRRVIRTTTVTIDST